MQEYRQQQFDLLADGVRRALDMNAVYAAMGLENRRKHSMTRNTICPPTLSGRAFLSSRQSWTQWG